MVKIIPALIKIGKVINIQLLGRKFGVNLKEDDKYLQVMDFKYVL